MELEHTFRPGRSRCKTASDAPECVKSVESDMPHQCDVRTRSAIDQRLCARWLWRQEVLKFRKAGGAIGVTITHPLYRARPLPIVRPCPLGEDYGDIVRL